MRTRFARITSTRSGQGSVLDELTERDRWIFNSFQFLRPHIVRVPSRQSKVKYRAFCYIDEMSINLAQNTFVCLHVFSVYIAIDILNIYYY